MIGKETIEWRDPVQDLAPLDETVLVCYQESRGRRPEVFLGYQDEDDIWRDPTGTEYERVLAWALLPRGVTL